jgi:ABC-type branched-subunit amino acid transport system permease subunit
LNIQLGYAGLLNFAGASMMGLGAYTAALAGQHFPQLPSLLVLPLGGLFAALIGSILLLPMLRTVGHYSAVVTIAFGLLFTTFLDSFRFFGGSQGLPAPSMRIFSWDFSEPLHVGSFEFAFYANYLIVALALLSLTFIFVQRIERSWIGLKLDAVRSDEVASSCYGISIAGAKFFAFTSGNFIMGMAGALYALALGYIAPSNFSFGDSLILISIILLGGIGSNWGVLVTTVIVLVLPERLQAIQEYRLFMYAVVVLLVLLFVPKGLILRPIRRYFPEHGER